MHRDLNDIIPPSRRRKEGMDSPAAPQQTRGEPTPPPHPAPSMGDIAPGTPTLPPQPRPFTPTPIERPMTSESLPPELPLPRRRFRSGGRFPYVTALIALIVIALCAGVLYAFSGAKVTITPTSNPATIQADLTANAGQGSLPFQVVTVQKSATVNVPAESTENANDPASGSITITNQQTIAQPLITNTRFATPDGLIFRIHAPVTIPAGGSITATVYADQPGANYNIGTTTFTVPGLKGGASYNLVTAKSNGPMTGGFQGQRPSVSQATKTSQYAAIQAKLATDLASALSTQLPKGYVVVPGASVTTYQPVNDAAGPNKTVTLGEEGTTIAIAFPAAALAQTIAYSAVGSYEGQPVTVNDVSGLTAKPADPTQINPAATTFAFNLSGTTTVIYQVDPSKIAGAVAGKNRNAAELALQSLPEVAQATLVLRPFWTTTFPGDPNKIKVVVANPASK